MRIIMIDRFTKRAACSLRYSATGRIFARDICDISRRSHDGSMTMPVASVGEDQVSITSSNAIGGEAPPRVVRIGLSVRGDVGAVHHDQRGGRALGRSRAAICGLGDGG